MVILPCPAARQHVTTNQLANFVCVGVGVCVTGVFCYAVNLSLDRSFSTVQENIHPPPPHTHTRKKRNAKEWNGRNVIVRKNNYWQSNTRDKEIMEHKINNGTHIWEYDNLNLLKHRDRMTKRLHVCVCYAGNLSWARCRSSTVPQERNYQRSGKKYIQERKGKKLSTLRKEIKCKRYPSEKKNEVL